MTPLGYESFLLCAHDACVLSILPQDSAMVSKTRSYRNAGFW